jgi:hypothetical protein
MKNIKTSHILFSLALIAVLTLAAIPAAPAYALSASATNPMIAANQVSAPALASNGVIVCRTVIRWHNGHRVAVRLCHRVEKPAS